ncbi:MAG: hypothetical protein HUK20_07610 [Fibrobacter sp.]|nr:hypothetical protein [Fibrobacter sp.]
MKITYFDNHFDTQNPKTCDTAILIEAIRVGGKVGWIRDACNQIRQNPQDHALKTQIKATLPMILWQGLFSERNDAGVIRLSGLMCIDLDHLQIDDPETLKDKLRYDPHVYAAFVSPSGEGLKVVFMTDNSDANAYINCYKQLAKHFWDDYGLKPDMNCAKLSQGCYASWDPTLYYNPNPTPFHVVYDPAFEPAATKVSHASSTVSQVVNPAVLTPTAGFLKQFSSMTDDDIMKILDLKFHKFPQNYTVGHRTQSIFAQACDLCKAGIPYDVALDYLRDQFLPTGYDAWKLEVNVRNAYAKNKDNFGCERRNYKPYPEYIKSKNGA